MTPTLGCSAEGGFVFGPVVQRRRVEVSTARPNHRANLRIKSDLGEHGRVTQWTVKLALQDGFEVNRAAQAIVEAQAQRIRREVLDRGNAINRMIHTITLLQRSNRCRSAALLKELPIGQ